VWFRAVKHVKVCSCLVSGMTRMVPLVMWLILEIYESLICRFSYLSLSVNLANLKQGGCWNKIFDLFPLHIFCLWYE